MSHLCMDRCIFYSETLAYDSSSNVTVQQSVLVETLRGNVKVQQSGSVETLPDNSRSSVKVQQSVLVETLPENSSLGK